MTALMGVENIWENVPSSLFCCEPTNALKVLLKKKQIQGWENGFMSSDP